MRLQPSIIILGLFLAAPVALAKDVSIQLAHNSDCGQQAEAQLKPIPGQHETSRYTFTHTVIEEHAIPHRPVLTLNTRHLRDDDAPLSAFLHEQIHWIPDEHPAQTDAAEQGLKKWYANPPAGAPEGAQGLESDYHLIVGELGREADLKPLGSNRWSFRSTIGD